MLDQIVKQLKKIEEQSKAVAEKRNEIHSQLISMDAELLRLQGGARELLAIKKGLEEKPKNDDPKQGA